MVVNQKKNLGLAKQEAPNQVAQKQKKKSKLGSKKKSGGSPHKAVQNKEMEFCVGKGFLPFELRVPKKQHHMSIYQHDDHIHFLTKLLELSIELYHKMFLSYLLQSHA